MKVQKLWLIWRIYFGVILLQWDEGNMYRIQLVDGHNRNVWALADTDEFVCTRSSGDGIKVPT